MIGPFIRKLHNLISKLVLNWRTPTTPFQGYSRFRRSFHDLFQCWSLTNTRADVRFFLWTAICKPLTLVSKIGPLIAEWKTIELSMKEKFWFLKPN